MPKWEFRVRGEPVAQPRPRSRAVPAKRHFIAGRFQPPRWRAEVYDSDGDAAPWKGFVRAAAMRVLPDVPIADLVEARLTFVFPRPQRLFRKKDPTGRIPCGSKPDLDNLEKAVLDALVGCRFLDDDALVWDLHSQKFYCAVAGDEPCCEIVITTDGDALPVTGGSLFA